MPASGHPLNGWFRPLSSRRSWFMILQPTSLLSLAWSPSDRTFSAWLQRTLSLLCEANEVGTLLLTQNNNNTGYENNNVHQILQLRTLVKTSRCTQFPFPRILLHKAPRKASMKRYFKNRLFQFWIQIQVSTCLKWKKEKSHFPRNLWNGPCHFRKITIRRRSLTDRTWHTRS